MNGRLHLSCLAFVVGAATACLTGSPAEAASHEGTDFTYTSAPTVAEAQGILRHLGYLETGSYSRGELDGATGEALRRFQRTHALRPTGQVDGETLAQLLQHRPATIGGPLVLKGVRFDTGSARLESESLVILDKVARSLRSNPLVRVEITGHADSTGTAAGNRKLSKARADAVRDYLASKGVPASRLETRGHGSRHPIAGNDTKAGRAENRRVELARFS